MPSYTLSSSSCAFPLAGVAICLAFLSLPEGTYAQPTDQWKLKVVAWKDLEEEIPNDCEVEFNNQSFPTPAEISGIPATGKQKVIIRLIRVDQHDIYYLHPVRQGKLKTPQEHDPVYMAKAYAITVWGDVRRADYYIKLIEQEYQRIDLSKMD